MVFNSSDMMKHGFKNHIFSTKTVGNDSEKWAQIQYKTYRFIDFTKLKSRDPVGFQGLPALTHSTTSLWAHIRAGELEAGSCKLGRKLQAGCKLGRERRAAS